MNFFAIQVVSGHEAVYKELFSINRPDVTMYHIVKKNVSRRRGKPVTIQSSVFPGYLFFQHPDEHLSPELIQAIRKTKYFLRILPATDNIQPLCQRDTDIIRQFLSCGPVIGDSRVVFDENNKIKVIDGPLAGHEGKIVKVNKRKRRATILLDICNSQMTIVLGFEILEAIETAKT
ncbi:MAG: KOW motif-containing protein [Spirochaetia bacterium]|nr:KOW motif-containing protein [Spirochaetia bacterium]